MKGLRVFLFFVCFSLMFSVISSYVFATNTTLVGNVTFVEVNTTTFVGNVTTPRWGVILGSFGAKLTFTNESANCYTNTSSILFAQPPGSTGASFAITLNQSAVNQSTCSYKVELLKVVLM